MELLDKNQVFGNKINEDIIFSLSKFLDLDIYFCPHKKKIGLVSSSKDNFICLNKIDLDKLILQLLVLSRKLE